MIENIRQFVVQLLLEKGPIPEDLILDDYRYLDSGHIDSMGFIKFVFRIEERFGIQFVDAEIGGVEARTIGGLVHLIENKTRK